MSRYLIEAQGEYGYSPAEDFTNGVVGLFIFIVVALLAIIGVGVWSIGRTSAAGPQRSWAEPPTPSRPRTRYQSGKSLSIQVPVEDTDLAESIMRPAQAGHVSQYRVEFTSDPDIPPDRRNRVASAIIDLVARGQVDRLFLVNPPVWITEAMADAAGFASVEVDHGPNYMTLCERCPT
jgi:hypothetical protein